MVRSRLGSLVLAALVVLTGCTGSDEPDRPAGTDGTLSGTQVQLSGTLVQYRPDVGSRRLAVQLTSRGPEPVRLLGVRLRSPALTRLPPTAKDTTYVQGQTIDLSTRYGTPRCRQSVSGGDVSVRAEVLVREGESTELVPVAIDRRGHALVRRLVRGECALVELGRSVQVRYVAGFRRGVDPGGQAVLRGTVLFRRPPAARPGPLITVPSIDGSVLVDFRAAGRPGPAGPLVRMLPATGSVRLPVELASTGRCDPHTRGESKQTFLLSVYVRLGAAPLQHLTLEPDGGTQLRVLQVIDDTCG